MFINCPNCSALVATDLATGLPPERCAQCGFGPLSEKALAGPAFPPAPLAAPPPPEPVKPQAQPVFIPLTPSRPATAAATDAPPAQEDGPTAPGPPTPVSSPAPAPAPPQAAAPAVTATPPDPLPAPPRPEATIAGPAAAGPALIEAPAPGLRAGDPAVGAAPAETAAPARPAPRFLARRDAGAGATHDRRHVAIAAGLAALLVVQLLLADRERLAGIAAWRPIVAALCAPLPCSLPPWREPQAIGVEQRDVRPVAERPGVLRVSATIRNEARWAQAWPRLVLTLSDLDGRALGMRAFEPAEYLAAPPTDITIASGQEAAISMEIVEPSPHAVAFNFDFR